MLDHIMADFENDYPDNTPCRITRTGHKWIRTEMLSRAKEGTNFLYSAATRMESPVQEWTPADVASVRRIARLVDEIAIRLWLSSLFGISYELD